MGVGLKPSGHSRTIPSPISIGMVSVKWVLILNQVAMEGQYHHPSALGWSVGNGCARTYVIIHINCVIYLWQKPVDLC